MLVYATKLSFVPSTDLRAPLEVTARWLSRKVKRQVSVTALLSGGEREFDGSHHVSALAASPGYPEMVSVAYSHPDAMVSGRRWTTEIGVRRRQPGAELECTVLLQTSEISSRVATAVRVSRPGLITELVNRCSLSPSTQGSRLHDLDDNSAEAFRQVVQDAARRYSLIVLSPDAQGQYLADPARLRSMVLGLADVVVIAAGTDTFLLSRLVGKPYVPYLGAARLIYPQAPSSDGSFVPARVVTQADALELRAHGVSVEDELLSLVTHRSNLPLSWAHVGPQMVRDEQARRNLQAKKDEAERTGYNAEYLGLLEGVNAELEAKLAAETARLESFEKLFQAQDDTERRLQFELDALKSQLRAVGRAPSQGEDMSAEAQAVAAHIARAMEGEPSPEEALAIIEHFFEDRVEVLPEAWKSARDSAGFVRGRKLFRLLYDLVTAYWAALSSGKPDAEAKAVFGNAYAATESERVARNRGARERRTFIWRGRELEMMPHLKIGAKDSVAETIRVHFEWIPDEKRIVIGYCGRHIPFR